MKATPSATGSGPRLADRLADLEAGDHHRADPASWVALGALAARMEAEGRGRDDPIRAVFGLLGDRWGMLVLLTLGTGEWRHATLRRIVGTLSIEGAISQRVLTSKLRVMERDGFVERLVGQEVPPRVSYRLTDMGAALLERATVMLHWVGEQREAVATSRRRFDERHDDWP